MATEWKLLLVDVYLEDMVLTDIVSESWRLDDSELLYPHSTVKGPKMQIYVRKHQIPDEETWRRVPYDLIRVCGKIVFL